MECVPISMEGGEWSSMNGVSIIEEADFMANLFSSSSFDKNREMSRLSLSSSYYSSHESNIDSNSNLHSLSQGSNYSESNDNVAYQQCNENYCLSNSDHFFAVNGGNSLAPVEFCLDTKGVVQVFPGILMERNQNLDIEMSCDNLDDSEAYLIQPESSNINAKHEKLEIVPAEEVKSIDSLDGEKKGSRNSEVQMGKRNTRSRRGRKQSSDDEENSPSLKKQNTDEDLSVELSNVKTRASRGSATDPQSLYARKRRERINERLRILQSLVPNGTKVDMSTMLEEAVSYVKFLQLQIKLLSSDDLWMYAPLAYNGMDIGLDAKLNSLS